LSLKPFGCLPSSALSDGILLPVMVARGGPAFLAVETTGDADASVDSRVEMALHAATLRAADELDQARAKAGLTASGATEVLRGAAWPTTTPRTYACTAAERLAATGTAH
jgi:predicted nucleotide-binding protein (sugar kinase/HSP70/actin superfamily)